MRRVLALGFLLAAACGGEAETPDTQFSFQQHELGCAIPDLQARLSTPCAKTECPVDDPFCAQPVCPLIVQPDQTVIGACPINQTEQPGGEGAICDFRIEYYVQLQTSSIELILASVLARSDLRRETKKRVRVEFPQSALNTEDFDRDSDGRTNVEELCAGTDPEVPD